MFKSNTLNQDCHKKDHPSGQPFHSFSYTNMAGLLSDAVNRVPTGFFHV